MIKRKQKAVMSSAKPESSDIERSTIQGYTNFGLKARAI